MQKRFPIIAVGDTFLKTTSSTLRPFSPEIVSLFQSGFCVLANLETVLADGGQPIQEAVTLRTDPNMAKYLREVGVNVVNIANNHIMDYGVEGLHMTCDALVDAGVKYVGTVQQGEQHPHILSVDGCKIGVLGYADLGSNNRDLGIAALDERQIQKDIANLKTHNADRVMVNLHWGKEYVAYPSPEQQRLARRLIDYGADVIIGHHPHVVQGIESYRNGIILYSLGNFNFKSASNIDQCFPSARWGLIVLLDFSSFSQIGHECIPVWIDAEYRPCLPPQDERAAFLAYLDRISEPLVPGIKQLFWYREASWPHFRNHIPAFIRRIRKYGGRHFYQMLRWLVSPRNYGFCLGLILRSVSEVTGEHRSPECPRPIGQYDPIGQYE